MKTAIPRIKIDLASSLPKEIENFIFRNETKLGGDQLFLHVHFNENIDFFTFSKDWELLKVCIKEGMIKDKARNPLTLETIKPYLESYSAGFAKGFHGFEQQISSGMFTSDEIKARKIYEAASPWRCGGFPERGGDGKSGTYITKELWHDAGIKAGHFYKAWYIIADNHELFIKYFKNSELGARSFKWNGNDEQKKALCQVLKDKGYIHPDTTNKAFTAIFSGQLIDNSLHRVTWIKETNRRKAHKTALREFLTFLLSKFQDKTVPLFFIDKHQKPISLAKPKKDEKSWYYDELYQIVKSVKK